MLAKRASFCRDLETLFEVGRVGDWTDAQLLERFLTYQDTSAQAAFAALVHRHGPMVMRVCQGILNDEHDTWDAFQATFLVLVRRARAIRNRSSVASWLHGVAHRVASRAKAGMARRRIHEQRAAVMDAVRRQDDRGGTIAERSILEEEIGSLPEKYRAVVIVCYLEGLSQEQAARQLGWPPGTVRGRLCRARELLRTRLKRRGLMVSADAVAVGLLPREAMALAPTLVNVTVRTAVVSGATKLWARGAVATLVKGAALGVFDAKLKMISAFLGLGLVTAPILGISEKPSSSPPNARSFRPVEVPTTMRLAESPPNAGGVETKAATPGTPTRPEPGHRDSVAVAMPIDPIVVDGDLSDWPSGLKRYPLLKIHVAAPYAYGGLERLSLADNSDLSAWFSVGYDKGEQLVYLALVVRDDILIVGHNNNADTDAVEVYVDGLFGTRKIPAPRPPWWDRVRLEDVPVQQYLALPGPGRVYGTPYSTNPILLAGDLSKTKTRMAYRRSNDAHVTTYEWVIQPFDRYPDRPTKLVPGKRIGFDIAVADKDVPALSTNEANMPVQDRPSWIYWGPTLTDNKAFDAGSLGELILGEASDAANAAR